MASTDADRSPEHVPPADTPPAGETAAGVPATPRSWSSARIWGLALAAGLLAGIASWLVGEAVYGRYKPELLHSAGFPTVDELQAAARERNSALTLEVSLTFAGMGAALGLALGLAGGTARGSVRAASIAGGGGTDRGGGRDDPGGLCRGRDGPAPAADLFRALSPGSR